jgi:hypothetical protein
VATAVTALLMLLAAVGAWAGLAWVILDIPPARPFALVVVYLFAFTGLTSTVALAAWAVVRPRDGAGQLGSPAAYLGHAALLAVIALFGLWLQSLRMLTPVVGLLLVGLYGFLELALLFGTRGAVELDVRPALEQRRDA